MKVGNSIPQYRTSLLSYSAFPIIFACGWGTVPMVELLIEQGCDITLRGQFLTDCEYSYESNALGTACLNGNVEVVRFLLTKFGKELIDFKCIKHALPFECPHTPTEEVEFDPTNYTPLMMAVSTENILPEYKLSIAR